MSKYFTEFLKNFKACLVAYFRIRCSNARTMERDIKEGRKGRRKGETERKKEKEKQRGRMERRRDTDVKNRPLDSVGEGKGGMI